MDEDKKHICYNVTDGFYIIGKDYKKIISDNVIYRMDYYINIMDNHIYEKPVLVLDKNDQSMIGIHEYMYMDQDDIVGDAKINYSEFCTYCKGMDPHSVNLHNSFL